MNEPQMYSLFFFLKDPAPPEIYPLPHHAALPISLRHADAGLAGRARVAVRHVGRGFLAMHMQPLDLGAAFHHGEGFAKHRRHVKDVRDAVALDRKSTRLNSSHSQISYAVFCLTNK